MAIPEAIHCITCAKDISKSSRDQGKLGPDSTGNPVARKLALSGWKFLFRKQLQQSPCNDAGDHKGAGEEHSKGSFYTQLERFLTSFPAKKDMITFNCKLFDVSYSNCLAANEAEARILSSDLLVVAYFHSHRLVS